MSVPVRLDHDAQSLGARQACRDVVLASFTLADAGRRARMADLFTIDGVQSINGAVVRGREQIRSALAARDAMPDRRTAHVVTELEFTTVHDDANQLAVKGFVLLYLLQEDTGPRAEPNALVLLEDVFVQQSGVWLLSSRHLTTLVGSG